MPTSSISTNTRASLSSIRSWIFWNILVTSLPLWNQNTLSTNLHHHAAWHTHVLAWYHPDPGCSHKSTVSWWPSENSLNQRSQVCRGGSQSKCLLSLLHVPGHWDLIPHRLLSRATWLTCLPSSYFPFPSCPHNWEWDESWVQTWKPAGHTPYGHSLFPLSSPEGPTDRVAWRRALQ